MTKPLSPRVDWPALMAEVYGPGDSHRGRGPRRSSMPRLALMTPEPEPATWRARFATFRADLDAQRRSA
jgi:hypothetical protein